MNDWLTAGNPVRNRSVEMVFDAGTTTHNGGFKRIVRLFI